MSEWFAAFFDGLYRDILANTFSAQQSETHARIVLQLLQLRPGQQLLDVPCGLGRLSLPLARHGLCVTGMDATASYIEAARRQARQDGVSACFMHGDMREMTFDGQFDAVLNWFGSFGYFADADMLELTRGFYRALQPGGRLLVEGVNRPWLLAHFCPESEHCIGAVAISQSHRWDEESKRLESRWLLRRDDVREEHCVSLRLYNGTELRRLLYRGGFRDIRLWGGYPAVERFTRHSRRFLAVGVRPRVRRGCVPVSETG